MENNLNECIKKEVLEKEYTYIYFNFSNIGFQY